MRESLALAFMLASLLATALAYTSHVDESIDDAFARRAIAAHKESR